jgi:hypothetical protein
LPGTADLLILTIGLVFIIQLTWWYIPLFPIYIGVLDIYASL